VLELADQIELSGEQRERVRQLYDSMKAEAVPVGEILIAHISEEGVPAVIMTQSPPSESGR
jgi:hypothetical protein